MRQTRTQQLTQLILAVFQLNGTLVDWGNEFSAPQGLTSARWQMLGALALAGQPLTTPQIAANMGVSRQGALKQLNLLAQDGLVEARDNPQHKRSPLFTLTLHGQKIYAAIDQHWRDHATRVAAAFSSTDLDTAARVLARLAGMHARPESRHET
uniref:MarR family winged helix-turn-helix transcriptional regulator n=1 Tax=Castellaniella defragrans TaxID=75697 RepID=UPI0033414549